MDNPWFSEVWKGSVIIALSFLLLLCGIAQAQFSTFCHPWYYVWPDSLCMINMDLLFPYVGYLYFNSINSYMLGYNPFTPFLPKSNAIPCFPPWSCDYPFPTYPYFGSPYLTAFPYATMPGTPIPYERFDYPTYSYGSPEFYLMWVLLQ